MPYHENIGDMIARALAVPEARYAWDFIVSEYKRAPDLRPDRKTPNERMLWRSLSRARCRPTAGMNFWI